MIKETGYGMVRYSKKSGKVDTAMTGMGDALLNMWCLQNTTKSKESMVFDLETGAIVSHYVGTADGFPKADKNVSGNVDEPVREALAEDWKNRK